MMCVGEPFSAKSSVVDVLQEAITNLKGKVEGMEDVRTFKMNPKSVNPN